MTIEFENGLNDIKTTLVDYHDRQEKKLNQLWAAVGRSGTYVADANDMENDRELRSFLREGIRTKALSSHDESGAYLVSQPVQDQIQQRQVLHGGLRGLSRHTRISTDALELLIDKKSADAGWVAETDERNESATPELLRHKIGVHELYAKPRISQKLLDDAAIDLEGWLVDKVAQKMTQLENQSFVKGDGIGKPKGFLSYPLVHVGAGTWGSIEAVHTGHNGSIMDIDVLYATLEAMKPEFLDGAVWYVARSAVTQIRRLKTRDGMPIWQPSLLLREPDLLLGYPVILSDDMPPAREGEVSTSIVLANFKRGYQIVDRHEMRLLRDPYSAKPFVEFYATKRVGGDVIDFDAFKAIRFSEV